MPLLVRKEYAHRLDLTNDVIERAWLFWERIETLLRSKYSEANFERFEPVVLCLAAISIEYEQIDAKFCEVLSQVWLQLDPSGKTQRESPQSYNELRTRGELGRLVSKLKEPGRIRNNSIRMQLIAKTEELAILWEAQAVATAADEFILRLLSGKTFECLSKNLSSKDLVTEVAKTRFQNVSRMNGLPNGLSAILDENWFIAVANFKISFLQIKEDDDDQRDVLKVETVRFHSIKFYR